MATYQGAFEPAHVRRISAVDVVASVVGYVLTITFMASVLAFAAFGIAFAIEEISDWAV